MNAFHMNAFYVGVAFTLALSNGRVNAQVVAPSPITAKTTLFAGTMQHCSPLNLCTNASLSALGAIAAFENGNTSLSLQAGTLASLLEDVQMGSVESLVGHIQADIDIQISALDQLNQNVLAVQAVASGIGPTRITAGTSLGSLDVSAIETDLDVSRVTAAGVWTTVLRGALELSSMSIGGNRLTGHFAAGASIPVSGPITLPAINLGPLNLGTQQQLFTGTMTVQQPSQAVDPANGDFLIQSVVPLLISGVAPDGLGGTYKIEFRIGETSLRKSLLGADGVRIAPATITFDPTGLAGLTVLPPAH